MTAPTAISSFFAMPHLRQVRRRVYSKSRREGTKIRAARVSGWTLPGDACVGCVRPQTSRAPDVLIRFDDFGKPLEQVEGLASRIAGRERGVGNGPSNARLDRLEFRDDSQVLLEIPSAGREGIGCIERGIEDRPGNGAIRLRKLRDERLDLLRRELWERRVDLPIGQPGV